MVKCKFLSLLKMSNYTSRALLAIIIVQQLVLFIHERDVSVHSTHSQTRCTSYFNSFTNEISLLFRVRLKSKLISEGHIRSKHSTNHMLRRISYSKAIGSRISQSLTGLNSPQCKQRRAAVEGGNSVNEK